VEEVSTEGETQQDEESIGRNEDDLVTIGIFWNGANAAIAQQYLVSMGIEAFVMDDVTANMLSFTGMFSVRVQVPGHQAEMARKLLEEQQEFALEDGLDGEFADGASDGGAGVDGTGDCTDDGDPDAAIIRAENHAFSFGFVGAVLGVLVAIFMAQMPGYSLLAIVGCPLVGYVIGGWYVTHSCSRCGASLHSGDRKCPECGASLPRDVSSQ